MIAIGGCNKETYTVTFNPNGGNGSMSAQTFTEGESQVLNHNEYIREGYSFSAWNTASDGTGGQYSDGQSITVTSDMILYAQWTGNPVTVTFDANGGEGFMNPQSFIVGAAQALNRNTYSRSGYSFAGWNTYYNGTGVQYSDGEIIQFSSDSDIILYAQWTNGGTSGGDGGGTSAISAPTGVTARIDEANGEVVIYVTWNSVSNAVRYGVYYSTTSNGSYSNMGYTPNNYCTITNPSTDNYFKVTAVDSNGTESDMSAYAYCRYNGGGGGSSISAPTGVSASIETYEGVDYLYVEWNSVPNAVKYNLYYSTTSNGTYNYVGWIDDTYCFIENPQTDNYVKVTAVDSNGNESSMSAYAYCHYNGGGGGGTSVPNAPTNVTASNVGTSSSPQVLISWSSVSDATSYKVYRSSSANGSYSQLGSATANTSMYDNNPMSGYNYYKVKAVNSAGESPYSSYAYFNNNAGSGGGDTPSSPCPPTVSVSGTTSQTVSWTVSTGSGCGTPTSYEVYHQDPCTSQMELMTTTTSRSYSVPSSYINPGVNRYAVKAINSAGSVAGYGTSSEVSLAKPSSFNVQKLGNDGIKFTWSSVAKATGYQVYYSSSANGSYYIWNEYDAPTTEQICSFPGSSGTTYYFKIRAIYSCGTSPVYSDFTTYSSVTF